MLGFGARGSEFGVVSLGFWVKDLGSKSWLLICAASKLF